MRRIGVSILFASWCVLAQPALAQELTARQQFILQTAMATDGWATEAMHREFWSAVPASIRSNPSSLFKFTSLIFLPASDALHSQKETWESVRLTLAAKRVTKTMGYGLGGTPQEQASADAL